MKVWSLAYKLRAFLILDDGISVFYKCIMSFFERFRYYPVAPVQEGTVGNEQDPFDRSIRFCGRSCS